jgi:hypothetical protein
MNESNKPLGAGLVSSPIQFKEWKDSSVEEKLEKLRDEARSHRYFGTRIYELSEKISRLFKHSHSERTGDMVGPISEYTNQLTGDCKMSKDNLS